MYINKIQELIENWEEKQESELIWDEIVISQTKLTEVQSFRYATNVKNADFILFWDENYHLRIKTEVIPYLPIMN